MWAARATIAAAASAKAVIGIKTEGVRYGDPGRLPVVWDIGMTIEGG